MSFKEVLYIKTHIRKVCVIFLPHHEKIPACYTALFCYFRCQRVYPDAMSEWGNMPEH